MNRYETHCVGVVVVAALLLDRAALGASFSPGLVSEVQAYQC